MTNLIQPPDDRQNRALPAQPSGRCRGLQRRPISLR